ncbi:hypothetical protein UCDDA912_g04366 [Diaporthe ampelina]|uniref:Uncharacterized protein n=1 Tax=Diaporthe ampelina TaxID=1214573 RepID=A0A0G2I6W2_9PEZI|nr:hypothetical protein UCDDA912_g04366 [Diaporthe ampelina]
MMEGRDYAEDDEGLFRFDNEEEEAAFLSGLHEDDLMEPLTPAHQLPGHDQSDDDDLVIDDVEGGAQDQGVFTRHEPTGDELKDNGFVEIDADGVQAMFNGNEADRVTAQKFQSEVLKTIKQNGKVVYMVGQATAQWWLSSEMQKRRRAAGRRMLDIGGAVASSAGNVIMNNTPIGGVVTSVSDNVTAFRAAPFRYTMQGLGIMKRDKSAAAALSPAAPDDRMSNDNFLAPDDDRHFAASPTIVQDQDEDDMLGVLNFDEDTDDI